MSELNPNDPNNLAEGEVEYEEEEQNEPIEEESDDFDAGSIKNKFETREIEDIQQEIQNVTKKIEHEKINLRITEERYEKTKNEYNRLQGKPEAKTKEDKEKERKEKKEKQKIKIEDQKKEPKQQNKHQILNETAKKKFFELMKQESEIDSLTKQINQVNLDCEDLKQQIEYLRKQKNSNESQLNGINKKNDKLTKDTKKLKEKNSNTNKNIEETDETELKNEEQKGLEQDREFLRKRDKLEDKYHKIIEAKILRERERKKEQAQKRQMLGMMAMNAMNNTKKTVGFKEIEDRIKTLKAQEISDRIPILDEVINKWKEINKVKKVMLEKYNKNAETIRDAFDIIMKFLGLYSYDELPIIFQKNEEQISSIEMYISELTNEKNSKEEHKNNLKKQIKELEDKIDKRDLEKTDFKSVKKENITELENKIKEVEKDIQEKREFFEKLKPDTENFLNKMNNTYVRDYVPNIIPLKDLKYSEDNIKFIIDNIQNYYTLITEFNQSYKKNQEDTVNREIDKLRDEMKNKLENFKKENYSKKLKRDLSNYGQNYDETIRRTAETIVECTNEGNMNLTKTKIKS